MNDVVEFNKKSRVRSEASIWLVRMQEGLNQSQKIELSDWLRADAMHQCELLKLADIWDELEVLTELAPLFDGVESRVDVTRRAQDLHSRVSWKRVIVAASLLIGCGVAATFLVSGRFGFQHTPSLTVSISPAETVSPIKVIGDSSSKRYQTPIGKQLEVELSDGSTATLNTDTQIEVEFTEQQRLIRLLKGEAHFSVSKDPTRPLVVNVSGRSVEAIGTAFCVRKTTDTEIEVSVDEGRVAVYQRLGSVARLKPEIKPILTASLKAGEVLTIVDGEPQLALYGQDEMFDRLAWREGMIVINDETLDYVIQEFKRYSEQKVLLADRSMGEIRVAGYFRLGDVDALLVALENNFNIRSEYYQDNHTYVLSQL